MSKNFNTNDNLEKKSPIQTQFDKVNALALTKQTINSNPLLQSFIQKKSQFYPLNSMTITPHK